MRQAITTKYLSPTNFRGARIKASAQAGHFTVVWDHSLGVEENHTQAARKFSEKFHWPLSCTTMHGGQMVDGRYCFVFVNNM